MYILKLNSFAKWARFEKLSEKQLVKLVAEIESGLVDADLGNGLVKKRLARTGQGKRDGYRVLLAFKAHDRVVFLFGFAKNEQENISNEQLGILKKISKDYLSMADEKVLDLIRDGSLVEVKTNDNA